MKQYGLLLTILMVSMHCKQREVNPQQSAVSQANANCQEGRSDFLVPDPKFKIKNYGFIPSHLDSDVKRFPENTAKLYETPLTQQDSLDLIASFWGDCADYAKEKIVSGVPIVMFYPGYGGPHQNPKNIWENYKLKWINDSFPEALILGIGWNYYAAENLPEPWRTNYARDESKDLLSLAVWAQELFAEVSADPAGFTYDAVNPGDQEYVENTQPQERMNDYVISMKSGVQHGSNLIDHLMMARKPYVLSEGQGGMNPVYVLGYSGGAHIVADLFYSFNIGSKDQRIIADYNIPWAVCETEDCSSICADRIGRPKMCTVSGLGFIKGGLAIGLSGWSKAAIDTFGKNRWNHHTYKGGLVSAKLNDLRRPNYHGKLKIFNRRTDPTGFAGSTIERGLTDGHYGEYNMNGHEYTQPWFESQRFGAVLKEFISNSDANDLLEFSIISDSSGFVDFNRYKSICDPRQTNADAGGDNCNYISTHFFYRHPEASGKDRYTKKVGQVGASPRDPDQYAESSSFALVPSRLNSATDWTDLAWEISEGGPTVALNLNDQEDAQGAVEFMYQLPNGFWQLPSGTKVGLFAYGGCSEKTQDSFLPDGYIHKTSSSKAEIVFTMRNVGGEETVTAKAFITEDNFAEGQWKHLSFNWAWPTKEIGNMPSQARALNLGMKGLGHGSVYRSSFRKLEGEGELAIYVNGEILPSPQNPAKSGPTDRECLSFAEVFSSPVGGAIVDHSLYLNPYRSYRQGSSVCKAFRIRGAQVAEFGCSHADGVSVAGGGKMDEILLVLGKGRLSFDNIEGDQTGPARLIPWTEVISR